jgi:uncharacterized protein YjeT (DUF2065 family)
MSWVLTGLGLVCVIEGLVLALAPSRLEQMLALIAAMTPDQRRLLGLTGVALGVGLVAVARAIG